MRKCLVNDSWKDGNLDVWLAPAQKSNLRRSIHKESRIQTIRFSKLREINKLLDKNQLGCMGKFLRKYNSEIVHKLHPIFTTTLKN